jgi:hypothetical protein
LYLPIKYRILFLISGEAVVVLARGSPGNVRRLKDGEEEDPANSL